MVSIPKTPLSPTIYAAGAVLYRQTHSGQIEIALIHRERYDDWSLPKGKLEKGETILEAAWRELKEETGYDFAIRGFVNKVVYYLPEKNSSSRRQSTASNSVTDKRKKVYYWAAEALGGNFIPNEEVDTLLWTSVEKSLEILSYPLDISVVQEFMNFPIHSTPLVIIRHAKAGERLPDLTQDQYRPLEKIGIDQALALSSWLEALEVEELHSANRVRCVSTLAPYAVKKQLSLQITETLSDEYYARYPRRAFQDLVNLCQTLEESQTIAAICSQGFYIPNILHDWSHVSPGITIETQARKASLWLLSVKGGKLLRAHYLSDPLYHPTE